MTLLPAVRRQIDLAATQRAGARRPGSLVASLVRRPQVSLGAAAAVCAASLTLLFASPMTGQPGSGRATATPPSADGILALATQSRSGAAADLSWDSGLSETIP